MSGPTPVEKDAKAAGIPLTVVQDASSEEGMAIYISPEREAAALRKFDRWLVPVAFAFLVLSSLDRNNVGLPATLHCPSTLFC